MPERRPLLRRAAYLAAVTTTIGVFAGSLAGIASTKGQVQPNGDAAALARKLQQREDVDAARGRRHALDPRAHRRARAEVHVDVARKVDVGPQREVGDRVAIA